MTESGEELVERVRSEPKARRRTRLQGLSRLKSGLAHPREEVAQLVAVNRQTVGQWLEKYEQGGVEGLVAINPHSNRRPALDSGVRQALVERRKAAEGFRSYGEGQGWRKEH